MAASVKVVTAARHLQRGSFWTGTRLPYEARGARVGWRSQTSSGQGAAGGSKVLGKSRFFRRGFTLSALSVLGYEAYTLFCQSAVVQAEAQVDEVLDQADYLYGSGETEKLYQLLDQHKNSENAEILWRLARALRDLAQLSQTSEEKKKQLTYEALDYAKKALEKDPSIFAVHKWYAICISDVGDYEGIKTKIANAFIIKEHFQKAIELNPKDATSLHLMGIWYKCVLAFTVGVTHLLKCHGIREKLLQLYSQHHQALPMRRYSAYKLLFVSVFLLLKCCKKCVSFNCLDLDDLKTYSNFIANLLQALRYFQKAEDVEPNFYSKNMLFLGKTYMKLNNTKMALLWLTKAKERLVHTEEDMQVN
ncbi:hypothetical protein lerEdw1_008879 [Lerista edwardsae]|nr:hypothetical protein lerEdw1_008879 [Lerista edwardsae]